MTPDSELLRHYADHGDEAAFAEVVRRHADFVYSVALRVTANSALAQDAAQTVFTILARRAAPLARCDTLVGWLHATTRHTAINLVRGEVRRRAREQEATAMEITATAPDVNWEQLRPLLDEAVARLGEADRKAVLLRFFQNLSHREVGATLGLSEDTARKRVERALDKLRAHFATRGVTVSSALLAAAITENSVQAAPVGLAAKVTTVSLANTGGIITSGALLTSFFALTMKTRILAGIATALLFMLLLNYAIISPSSSGRPVAASTATTKTPGTASTPSVPVQVSAQVAAPVIKPVVEVAASAPAPTATTSTTAPTATASVAADNPRLEIDAAMQDFVGLLESGNYVAAANNYLQLPPTMNGQQLIESMEQNPDFPNTVQMLINATRAAQTSLPIYDVTGNLATYQLLQPTDGKTMVRWKKVNGLWRVDAFE